MRRGFYIAEDEFRVWTPEFMVIEKSSNGVDEDYNSRQIRGILSTSSEDRQGERVLAKGLDLKPLLEHGHFNDNHDQATGAVVGYPERAHYSDDLRTVKGQKVEGWACDGYLLKGTRRSDEIWELAKALAQTPNRRLGFSIEGKVIRRSNNVIEKASIRNLAVTNCPVNTDATWDIIAKSFVNRDIAMKSLMAGYGLGPGSTGGAALAPESLDRRGDERPNTGGRRTGKKRRDLKGLKAIVRSLGHDPDDLLKAYRYTLELRPDFSQGAAAEFAFHLVTKGVPA